MCIKKKILFFPPCVYLDNATFKFGNLNLLFPNSCSGAVEASL